MLAITSTRMIAIANSGERVRGSTRERFPGMTRSNDHANMLRLTSSIVCGSQMNKPTAKPKMISTLHTATARRDAHDLRVGGGARREAVRGRVGEAEAPVEAVAGDVHERRDQDHDEQDRDSPALPGIEYRCVRLRIRISPAK